MNFGVTGGGSVIVSVNVQNCAHFMRECRFHQQVVLVFCEAGLYESVRQTKEATAVNQPLGWSAAALGRPKQMEAINHDLNIKAWKEGKVMCVA